MVNELLEFNVGEGEQPTNVQVPIEEENPTLPQVSNEAAASENNERELSDYSDKVKKRIDKLTARLRETQRREHAALDYAKQVQSRAQELEQRYVKSDADRLVEDEPLVQERVRQGAARLLQDVDRVQGRRAHAVLGTLEAEDRGDGELGEVVAIVRQDLRRQRRSRDAEQRVPERRRGLLRVVDRSRR